MSSHKTPLLKTTTNTEDPSFFRTSVLLPSFLIISDKMLVENYFTVFENQTRWGKVRTSAVTEINTRQKPQKTKLFTLSVASSFYEAWLDQVGKNHCFPMLQIHFQTKSYNYTAVQICTKPHTTNEIFRTIISLYFGYQRN